MRLRPLALSLVVAALSACSSGAPLPVPSSSGAAPSGSSAPAGSVELQVYAAASLKVALAKAATAYAAAHPGVTLTISTDSSAALETKIEQGAPADVFLSADTSNPQKVVAKGLASGQVVNFAGNQLTVIVPTANPGGVSTPQDLAKPGLKVITCAEGVPIQKYTAQWLDKVKALPAYGPDFLAKYTANIASREDNVGAIVAKIALGEGDAGVVYVTDAKTSDKVTTIAIPADQNVPATYGGVVVKGSAHQDAATAFLTWLAGPDGQAVLSSFGFLPAS